MKKTTSATRGCVDSLNVVVADVSVGVDVGVGVGKLATKNEPTYFDSIICNNFGGKKATKRKDESLNELPSRTYFSIDDDDDDEDDVVVQLCFIFSLFF